jgi:hypothetical protein
MRFLVALLLLCLTIAAPAAAQDSLRPVGQVPVLPLPQGDHPDIDALLRAHWAPYYNTQHEHGFGRDKVRAGRFDIDGDGRPELFVLIDQASWEAESGHPLVVAKWTQHGWSAIGWSWGDEDTIFATAEIIGGHRTIDTGTQFLRWGRGVYDRVEK